MCRRHPGASYLHKPKPAIKSIQIQTQNWLNVDALFIYPPFDCEIADDIINKKIVRAIIQSGYFEAGELVAVDFAP